MPSKYTLDSKEVDFQNPVYKRNAEAKTEANGQYDKYEANKVKLDDGNGSTSSSTSSKDEKDEGRKTKLPTVGFAEMFKYSTPGERFLMFLGTLSACANGASTPIMIIVFGNMADTLFISNDYANHLATYVPQWFAKCLNMTSIGPDACQNVTVNYILGDPSPPDRLQSTCEMLMYPAGCDVINDTALWNPESTLEDDMTGFSIIYIILACCVFVVAYLQVICWQITSYNQTQRIRTKLFRSILRQEIGWFDTHEAGELNSRLADDVDKIENGIGDQLGLFVQYISAFLAGIIIAFVYSWKLTLVVLSVSPLLALASMVIGKLGASMTARELKAYAKAGAVAEEVLVAIRTVVSFGGEAKECERYNKNLMAARNYGVRKGSVTGLALGALFLVMFGSYGLGFWYGSKMVFNFEISAGDMLTVFFCVLSGTFSLGSAAPNIQEFAGARGAAYVIYQIIENEPKIDSFSKDGKKDVKLSGNIEFQNVHFNYPSRPEVNVLQGLSMKISIGQTVALVGSSGCGKSTTVQLLQRFYDPHEGQVTLDGTDVRDYNVKWLRRQIGVVSQEPVLFATSIAENIRYGNEDVKMDDIIRACKEANAHDFVIKLPNKYDTLVGERGAQLSGGQKQRIAIARALVRNPKVLLLDEATSALDTESEASVQAALDKARQGRTTLVIAHRLSTIRTADVIVGVRDGQVVEQGTHDELMARNGLYYELVMNQQTRSADANEDDISLEEDIPMKPGFEHSVSVVSQGKRIRTFSALSGGSMMDKQSMTEEETEVLPEVGLKRIMRANAPEWPFLILGSFAALIAGGVQPAVAVVMSEFIGIFSDGGPDVMDKVNLYAGMFVVIGVGAGLATMLQNVSFSRSGENLTMRLRQLSFQSLMKQDMSYFDDHSNNVGALCTRLATDASAVQGATGSRLGMFCQAMSGLGAGLIIGLVFSWELTLLIVGFMPFLLLSGFIRMRVVSGNMAGRKIALEKAGKIAVEVIENIRTVATLTKEQKFLDDYEHETLKPFKDNKKKVYVHGGAFAFSSCVMFFAQAASFRLGAFLIVNRGLPIKNMFRVFSAVAFGAMSAGRAGSFAPDYGKAKASAAKVFALLDRVPSIDVTDKGGKKPSNCQGTIQLRDVHFNYPTRPNIAVLTGLDLNVRPGQTVALVGSSGCGKSTTVQLLERFYDPLQGDVSIEGESIHDLNLSWVRSQMGIVSQEPILFDCSIRDNIAYGDNSRNVSMAEIIEAAKNANIHSFIENLPQGYDTNVGDKGAQLSGGQKQRVAIARALVRNPKILLLDEATSALDTESEKVVQAALDRAQEGRTCIVIAHRLSTIQNADVIVVIHHGKVVEKGTHEELLQKKGRYYSLNNAQLKKDT